MSPYTQFLSAKELIFSSTSSGVPCTIIIIVRSSCLLVTTSTAQWQLCRRPKNHCALYASLYNYHLSLHCLCLYHCLCHCLCLCICVPNSFLNSCYHKLSENVWVWGSRSSRSEIWSGVTIVGQTNEQTNNEQGKIGLLSQRTMKG